MEREPVIGVIYSDKFLAKDDKLFLKLAKKKGIKLVMMNILGKINQKEMKEKVKSCDLIYNSTADDFALEMVKTVEEWGGNIIETSKDYYYTEDKWMFYLNCKKHHVPMPKTILLSENLNSAGKELKDFNKWPVILKKISGTMGEYVDRAENEEEAKKIMKKFWEKGQDMLPIIAQEFVKSPSYRVTIVGGKIVQAAMKTSTGWKATGVYAKKIKKFKVDKEVEKIVKKLKKFVKMSIWGIDFLKKDGKWLALEVNSAPAFDFFESQREKLISESLDLLKKIALKRIRNRK